MKKIFVLCIALIIVSGCTETRSISIEDHAPKKIEKNLDANATLQLFSTDKETYYIAYTTTKQIDDIPGIKESKTDDEKEHLTINIAEDAEQTQPTTYIFKFKSDKEYDTLDIEINGESTPIDNIVYL